jgi:hydrogenase maturation protein HypF
VASQPPRDVVLSGGCFLNKLLTERVVEAVQATGRRVFPHEQIPPGDAGLAAGQLAVAMGS